MARTLARSLAWIAVLAVLMAGGLFFKFLKDALTFYLGPSFKVEFERLLPKGSFESEVAYYVFCFLAFGWLAWLAYRWWKD